MNQQHHRFFLFTHVTILFLGKAETLAFSKTTRAFLFSFAQRIAAAEGGKTIVPVITISGFISINLLYTSLFIILRETV